VERAWTGAWAHWAEGDIRADVASVRGMTAAASCRLMQQRRLPFWPWRRPGRGGQLELHHVKRAGGLRGDVRVRSGAAWRSGLCAAEQAVNGAARAARGGGVLPPLGRSGA